MLITWRLNIVNIAILPKLVYRCNAISIKTQLVSVHKLIVDPKIYIWNFQTPTIAKIILEKKS